MEVQSLSIILESSSVSESSVGLQLTVDRFIQMFSQELHSITTGSETSQRFFDLKNDKL